MMMALRSSESIFPFQVDYSALYPRGQQSSYHNVRTCLNPFVQLQAYRLYLH